MLSYPGPSRAPRGLLAGALAVGLLRERCDAPPNHIDARSAPVDLFEVVALVAEALFLCVSVVVAALCPAPLLGLLLGRLRPPPPLPALASSVALRAQVRAARGLVAAAAPPALRPGVRLCLGLSLCLGLGLGLGLGLLGLLGGSGLGRSLSLLKRRGAERETHRYRLPEDWLLWV